MLVLGALLLPLISPPKKANCTASRSGQNFCRLRTGWREVKLKNVRTLNAHFDGKFIVLDEPAELKLNTKLKVLMVENDEALAGDFARLSEPAFKKIWDNPLDADYDEL